MITPVASSRCRAKSGSESKITVWVRRRIQFLRSLVRKMSVFEHMGANLSPNPYTATIVPKRLADNQEMAGFVVGLQAQFRKIEELWRPSNSS
jgi:hypothetical protein